MLNDLSANIVPLYGGAATAVTAGGSGDNTAINAVAIDQYAQTRCHSLAFVVAATATLGANQKLTVTAKLQDSPDNSVWTDVQAAETVLLLTSTAGGTVTGAGKIGIAVRKCKRYIRAVVTPDLDRANTDTAVVQILSLLGMPSNP